MALHGGVKVEIVSNKAVLPMYADPDVAEVGLASTPQYYIEAVTGATFAIRVTLTSEFQRGPCDAVRVRVNFDGDQVCYHQDVLKGSARVLPCEVNFRSISTQDHSTGRWVVGKPSFARLDTKEANDCKTPAPKVERVQNLGSIQVDATRIKLSGTLHGYLELGMKPITELPEKMLKVSKLMKSSLANVIASKAPPLAEGANRIRGPFGNRLITKILYRSRRNLQSLGCIPRTPSPEPSTATPDPEEEIKNLRARLALLERSSSVKREARKASGSIKRERGGTEDQHSRKRSRRDGSIGIVDLTEV